MAGLEKILMVVMSVVTLVVLSITLVVVHNQPTPKPVTVTQVWRCPTTCVVIL